MRGDGTDPLLAVENLRVRFATPMGTVHAVQAISFTVNACETLAIVGESGCGKSVTTMSILGLVPPTATIEGQIRFEGRDLVKCTARELRGIRGNKISMIFQEPETSLNPVLTIGKQIREPLRLHQGLSRREADRHAVRMLELVGISDPARHLASYPHELSGGMRQRVMIAIALACSPRLLIADEPTTALDVTIQAQILELMKDLKSHSNSALLLITHDLGVVAEMADRVIVMYAGKAVEEGEVEAVFSHPLHPYTRGLLGAVPKLGTASGDGRPEKLNDIPGSVPSLLQPTKGCAFAPRCKLATDLCVSTPPAIREEMPRHFVSCHHAGS